MATVGNLFVNVGASTRGLEQGLKRGQEQVKKFTDSTSKAAGAVASNIPGVDAIYARASSLKELVGGMRTMWDGFNGGVKAAAEQQARLTEALKQSKAAQQALASAKGTRKNIGMARAMLAQEGINPNRAAAALTIEDTSGARKKVTDAINAQRLAVEKLAGAEAFRAKAAKGRDPFTGQFLAAADKAKLLERATADVAKAQERVTAATNAATQAQAALGRTIASNQRKEAMRGKLRGMGIDLTRGQSALRLPSLAGFQEKAKAAAEAAQKLGQEVAASASGFKVFGLSVGKALGPVGLVAAAFAAATVGALALTRSQAKAMDALADQALMAGMGVEEFQRLNYAYHEVGVSAGTVETAAARLSVKLQDAVDGTEGAQESFKRLGLDFNALAQSTPDQALESVIGRIRELGSSQQRIAMLRDLFGKSGMGLAPAVNATAESLREAQENARKLTIPAQMVEQLAATNDKVEAASKSLENMKTMFASAMAPVLRDLAESITEMMTADTGALLGGLQSIALTLAVVYDVVALIVNAFSVVWNLLQAIGGVIVTAIMGALGAVLKVVEWIVYAVEYLTNAGHDISESIGGAAATAFGAAKEAAVAAGEDSAEALQRAVDAIKPDATMAVMEGIAKSWERQTSQMEGSPAALPVVADKASMRKVESELENLRDKLQSLEMGDAEATIAKMRQGGATDAQINEARGLQERIALLEREQKVHEVIADLNDQIAKATMSAAEWAEYEAVTKQGLAVADAARVRALQEELEVLEQQKRAREEIAATISDLQAKVDQLGMTEAEILRTKLLQQGATDAQIQQAMQLQSILDAAKVDEAVKGHFDALETRLLEAQGAHEELMRRQLEGMGLTGKALEDALQRTLDIEAQITEAERLKANQEEVASTLSGLADQLDKLKLGEAGYLEKKLKEQGATSQQIAEALAMQSEISALENADKAKTSATEDAQAVTDTLDTAIGGLKLAGVVSAGEQMQRGLLTEAEEQTGLLSSIATSMTAMVGSDRSAGSGVLMADEQGSSLRMQQPSGMATYEADMAALLKINNDYLAEIASNTAGLSGALT
jgi:hypothetical protein